MCVVQWNNSLELFPRFLYPWQCTLVKCEMGDRRKRKMKIGKVGEDKYPRAQSVLTQANFKDLLRGKLKTHNWRVNAQYPFWSLNMSCGVDIVQSEDSGLYLINQKCSDIVLMETRHVGTRKSQEKSFLDCNHSRLETSQTRNNLKRNVGRKIHALTQSHRRKTWKSKLWKSVAIPTSYHTSREPTQVKIHWNYINS